MPNNLINNNISEYTLFDEIDIENRMFVSWKDFETAVYHLYSRIVELDRGFINIYAIPRGGLCLGVKLSYLLNIPLIFDVAHITSDTLIVDDCTDTGKTLSRYKDNITAVMYHRSGSCFMPSIFFDETDKQINFCWESKEQRN
jgi:hypoxanthine phosphoribosyltransferase